LTAPIASLHYSAELQGCCFENVSPVIAGNKCPVIAGNKCPGIAGKICPGIAGI